MKKMSRKTFLIGGATAATVAAAGTCVCSKTVRATITGVGSTPPMDLNAYEVAKGGALRIQLNKVPELKEVGGAVKVIDPSISGSLIVVRETKESYVAASLHCTHRGVEVEYEAEDNCFECASLGGSRFGIEGEKISGFAKGPLKTYPVSIDQDVLIVSI